MIGSPHSGLRLSAVCAGFLLTFSIAAVVATSVVGKAGLFDRGVIAFVSVCAARTDGLFQVDVAHQIQLPLTSRYAPIYSLSYSPLGSWLVFEASERNQAFSRRVFAIDLQTQREYTLAPDYFSSNGTPLRWQSDGKYLELRMMSAAGTGIGIANVVVDVANGEVIDAVPVPDVFTPMDSRNSDQTSAMLLIPVSGFNAADTLNNRVDSDRSAQGDVVRSRRNGRSFDLYVQFAGNGGVIQITHDGCIERYPRWRP
jgi:hypothetical protein